jgi:hypothetical protein
MCVNSLAAIHCTSLHTQISSDVLSSMLTLIAFPLIFSINEAYHRRQKTLDAMSVLQSEL